MGIRVAYDVRAAQATDYPERGIARWVTAHVLAVASMPGIDDIILMGDRRAALPEPLRLAFPDGISDPRQAFVPASARDPVVHHIGSPFHPGVAGTELAAAAWPRATVIRSVTLHDSIPLVRPQWFDPRDVTAWRTRSAIVRFADVVLAISRHTAAEGRRLLGLSPHRLEVIGCASPDRPRPDHTTALPDGVRQPYVLYTGGLGDPRKNVPALIRAFGLLGEAARDVQLVLAGRADPATAGDLRSAAQRAGVGERLVMPGLVSDSTLARLYADAACVVYPSLYEGFGLPIAEAMQFGAPVVCSATTACSEVAPHPKATFDPTDDEDIARTIGEVLGNSSWAGRLRSLGSRRASELTWDKVARRSVERWALEVETRSRPPGTRRGLRTGATVVCDATPHAVSPGGAALLLARSLSRGHAVDLLAPVVQGAAGAGVRHRRPPGISGHISIRRPGPLFWVVDSPYSLGRAIAGLGVGGIAIVWEPDLLGTGEQGLKQLAQVADVVVTRPGLEPMIEWGHVVGITPPLLDRSVANTAGGIAPPLEEALLLSRRARFEYEPVRALHLIVRPPRFGAVVPTDVEAASDLAESMSAREADTRVVVLGEASGDHGSGHPAVRIMRWPRHLELLAWITAARSIQAGPEANASLAAAASDLAALGGARLNNGELPSLDGRDADSAARALLGLST